MIGGVFKNCFQQRLIFYETPVFCTICLSLFTVGWYAVTKGNSLSAVLCFCGLTADCFMSKVTSVKELSIYFFGYLRTSRRRFSKVYKALFKCCLLRVCSKQSYYFAFDKASFYPRRVARGKMGIL